MSQTLILTEKEGWHYQQLKLSLTKLNHSVDSASVSYTHLRAHET